MMAGQFACMTYVPSNVDARKKEIMLFLSFYF